MTNSCYNTDLITLEIALETIYKQLIPPTGSESISLLQGLDRVLIQPCYAPQPLPASANAAMDGYAFSSTDIQKKPFQLQKIGTSWAGKPFHGTLAAQQCVRIFTGAVIPKGVDSVIMQEQVNTKNNTVYFPKGTQAYQHIRPIGDDAQQGDCLLATPKQLTATDLGLLASAGLYHIKVKRKLRIAFFSSGDELKSIGSPLNEGDIYDSNRYTLKALLTHPCYNLTDLGVISDNKQRLSDTLKKAAQHHDMIISTGGASVGDADYIHEILADIGTVNFWKLAIKPGKPLAFGHINHCCFFGLPGNPISVITTFQQIVIPALQTLNGLKPKKRLHLQAKCQSVLSKKSGRLEFQRGYLSQLESGEFTVISTGKQGSNILTSNSRANCYIILAQEQTHIDLNQYVTVEPFDLFL